MEGILTLKSIFQILKKNVTHDDTSNFALETNLVSLKTDKLINIHKLDIYKLAPGPVDLSKLRDVVKMMLLKKLRMIN